MLREAAPPDPPQTPTTWGRLRGNWPPKRDLRGRREGFLEKEGSELDLEGFNSKGAESVSSAEERSRERKKRRGNV